MGMGLFQRSRQHYPLLFLEKCSKACAYVTQWWYQHFSQWRYRATGHSQPVNRMTLAQTMYHFSSGALVAGTEDGIKEP
jgi:ATP-dependent phosphoenolpyruvate carboxykinase